jgi:hypothetical protein
MIRLSPGRVASRSRGNGRLLSLSALHNHLCTDDDFKPHAAKPDVLAHEQSKVMFPSHEIAAMRAAEDLREKTSAMVAQHKPRRRGSSRTNWTVFGVEAHLSQPDKSPVSAS